MSHITWILFPRPGPAGATTAFGMTGLWITGASITFTFSLVRLLLRLESGVGVETTTGGAHGVMSAFGVLSSRLFSVFSSRLLLTFSVLEASISVFCAAFGILSDSKISGLSGEISSLISAVFCDSVSSFFFLSSSSLFFFSSASFLRSFSLFSSSSLLIRSEYRKYNQNYWFDAKRSYIIPKNKAIIFKLFEK